MILGDYVGGGMGTEVKFNIDIQGIHVIEGDQVIEAQYPHFFHPCEGLRITIYFSVIKGWESLDDYSEATLQ
jgi:hypothetical protein